MGGERMAFYGLGIRENLWVISWMWNILCMVSGFNFCTVIDR